MDRARLTITLRDDVLKKLDKQIDGVKIRNRSHAIEYLLSQILSPKVSQAVILAGGKGVKMRPLTYEVPKNLIPVGGKTLIEHTIEMLRDAGIREMIIAIGHLGEKIKEEIGNGRKYGVKITYSEEREALGSGGALRIAANFLAKKPFLVVNGDILTDFKVRDLIEFHNKDNYLATMALSNGRNTEGFGRVALRGERVVKFLKINNASEKSQHINAGIYVFNWKVTNYFPKEGRFDLDDVLVKLAEEGKLAGFPFDNRWFEISNPKAYAHAIKEFS